MVKTAQVKKALQSESDLNLAWPRWMGQWNPYSSSAVQPSLVEMVKRSDMDMAREFSESLPVGHVWVFAVPGLFIKDEMVLTGDEPLHSTAALHVLVAGSLHGPLPISARTVSHGVGLNRVLRLLRD